MRKICFFIFTAAAAALLPVSLSAQQNPFLSTGAGGPVSADSGPVQAAQTQDFQPAGKTATGFFYDSVFMQKIREAQKSFQARISGYITEYKSTQDISVLSGFLIFSFLYGLLHVIGPGHRKVFLFTYFVARPSEWKTGMLAGFMTAVLHALSAVIFIGGLYLVTVKALMSRFNNITPVIEKISYGAIIMLGIYLLVSQIIESVKGDRGQHDERSPDTVFFVLASGLIPCPGAATIMIFSMAVGAPAAGIYAVAAMSLGMGTVLTFIPPAAGLIRNRLNPVLSKLNPGSGEMLHGILSISGAAVLVLFGLFFIL